MIGATLYCLGHDAFFNMMV